MPLEPKSQPGSGQGSGWVGEVVIASPGASMDALRETLLASQGLALGPEQGQGQGQGPNQGQGLNQGQEQGQEEKREGSQEREESSIGAKQSRGQGQGPGQGLGPGSVGRVTRASLPAHQWRSVCAMLQLHGHGRRPHYPPPSHAYSWEEDKATTSTPAPGEIHS